MLRQTPKDHLKKQRNRQRSTGIARELDGFVRGLATSRMEDVMPKLNVDKTILIA